VQLASILTLCVFAALPQGVPTQPARDAVRRPEPTGTSAIRGRVIAADTGNPMRRARLTLVPLGPFPTGGGRGAGPRQATTNAQGVFEFTGLPAGSYNVIASVPEYSPQYLGMAYGAKKPSALFFSNMGQPIKLTDGQTFEKAVIALPRGAVISGRVTDENTDPLARVQVYAVYYAPGSARGRRVGAGAQTDDLGQFRIYGLSPGDYVVGAEARESTYVEPNAPPQSEADRVGFLTTYYPGTPDESSAQRVRTRPGAEIQGIEIRLGQGRLFRISGMIMDSQGQPGRVDGQLMRRGPGFMGGPGFGFSTDERGQFQMRNIPPGEYRLIVQQIRRDFGPPSPNEEVDPGEMAVVPLTVSADLDNVMVTTAASATITGQIVIEPASPAPRGVLRVMAASADQEGTMGMRQPQPGIVGPDLTFKMRGLFGRYLLRTFAPNLYVKSVAVGAEDITNSPREFKPDDRVVITLTSRASTLEGTVTGANGPATADTAVVAFSEDRESWRRSSTRTGRTVVDAEGHFRIPGLMPGRYLIVALPREQLNFFPGDDEENFFERLSKTAVPVVLGEDDHRKVDLRVGEDSGNQ
jgi:hypothetical protein